jgi:hypothetical protein
MLQRALRAAQDERDAALAENAVLRANPRLSANAEGEVTAAAPNRPTSQSIAEMLQEADKTMAVLERKGLVPTPASKPAHAGLSRAISALRPPMGVGGRFTR